MREPFQSLGWIAQGRAAGGLTDKANEGHRGGATVKGAARVEIVIKHKRPVLGVTGTQTT
jgi:hypothetical protein